MLRTFRKADEPRYLWIVRKAVAKTSLSSFSILGTDEMFSMKLTDEYLLSSGEDSFQLQGDCYGHGVMYGEALEKEDLSGRNFRIV